MGAADGKGVVKRRVFRNLHHWIASNERVVWVEKVSLSLYLYLCSRLL